MTKCVSCGTEADNASYCPECGDKIIREPIAPDPADSVDESNRWGTPNSAAVPGQSSVYTSDSRSAYRSEYSGESPAQINPNAQYTSGTYQKKPDGSGQMIFAVINIVISVLLCCCAYGIVPLVFAIIAVVYASGANKAMTVEEAESKLKTARILNIIALVTIIIGVVLAILYYVFLFNNPEFIDEMSRQGYNWN